MKRFKKILLVAENSIDLFESAAEKARELARINSASIKVVGVMQEGLFDLLGNKLFNQSSDISSLSIENFEDEIKTALSRSEWDGISMEVEILQGRPFISVIQQVLKHGFDLVVKQNNETKGVDNLAMRLLRKCPCPIWLVKRLDSAPFRSVLAAVDVSKNDNEQYLLNKKIVELAHSMGQREGGEVHYLYAWYLHAESMLRGPKFNWQEDEIFKFKHEIVENGKDNLQKLLGNIHIQPDDTQIHITEGKTEEKVHQLIEKKDIDLLVMGTIGRTGIPGLLIGNTAEIIVKNLKCSLMAVKPDGFVTPVSWS